MPPGHTLVPVPAVGRRFVASRRVRWGDADEHGRLRLDAVARYMQDVSNDDTRDLGLDPTAPWVVRRTEIAVERAPRAGEVVTLTTFCGGLGSRWAERRTSIVGERGGAVEAASLWVRIDAASGRPSRLTAEFLAAYSEAARGREVHARLLHHGPPIGGGTRRPWPLRTTDLDGMHHVNNAATWEPIEDELARRGLHASHAVLEYGDAIELHDDVQIVTVPPAGDNLAVWLTVAGSVRASAVVTVGTQQG